MKLWDKGSVTDKKIDLFTVGNDRELDLVLAKYDVQGSIAHAKMLTKIGVLTADELFFLEKELNAILDDVKAGNFIIEDEFEDEAVAMIRINSADHAHNLAPSAVL